MSQFEVTTTDIKCPNCQKKLDGCTSLDHDNGPAPGSLSMCVYCYTILEFTEDMNLRRLPDEDVKNLPEEIKLKFSKVIIVAKKVKVQMDN